ncbi:sulfide/dihydroorotate dehydrogenase-like FAD/NAD-binding protein [Candidatus Pyrohabitans sp.]
MRHEIVHKAELAPGYTLFIIRSPQIARKIQPGQFVIVRVHEKGERIPMTISDFDREAGTLTMVVHQVGKTSSMLASLEVGDTILDLLGPLGRPSEIRRYGNVVAVCRQGTAGALYSIVKALKRAGNRVTVIMGAKSRDYIIFEERMRRVCDQVIIATDDGSYGMRGYAVAALREHLKHSRADYILAIGPTKMMKTVAGIATRRGIKATASLGAIMLDGTGMCGACRVTVAGSTKFACVDGPEFDATEVDFDELQRRQVFFREEERLAFELYEEGT